MQPRPLEPGEIVQLAPTSRDRCGFGHISGCLMVVIETNRVEVVGYVKNVGSAQEYPLRVSFDDIEPTGGRVIWSTGAVPAIGEAGAEAAARDAAAARRG